VNEPFERNIATLAEKLPVVADYLDTDRAGITPNASEYSRSSRSSSMGISRCADGGVGANPKQPSQAAHVPPPRLKRRRLDPRRPAAPTLPQRSVS
jgi:hypothetical protein